MQKFLGTKTRSKGVVEVTGNERILPGKGPRATRPKAEEGVEILLMIRRWERKKPVKGTEKKLLEIHGDNLFTDSASQEPFSVFLQIICMVKVL